MVDVSASGQALSIASTRRFRQLALLRRCSTSIERIANTGEVGSLRRLTQR